MYHPYLTKAYGFIYLKRYKLICFVFFLLLLGCFPSFITQAYAEDTTAQSYIRWLSKAYPARNEAFLTHLKEKTTDKKLRKYYETSYRKIFAQFQEDIQDGIITKIPEINDALQHILLELQSTNPQIPKNIEVYLVRENIPNAFTIGDNSIYVNMGLLYYLENEDQVAAVISHEIAHLLQQHTLKTLTYKYHQNQIEQEAYKTLAKETISKADRAFDLVRSSVYQSGQLTRKHELEADSLGFELLRNTKYQAASFLKALQIIERNDSSRSEGVQEATYRKFFDLPEQPFKEDWLQVEDFSAYNYGSFKEKLDIDSLSSHPKLSERIQYLITTFPELAPAQATENTRDTTNFHPLQLLAEKQLIPNLYYNEQYGRVVYVSLYYLQHTPADSTYISWLGKGFQKIYEARRDYTLNKYLDRVSPKEQSESYIRFLSFMWNLKLDEMNRIAAYYHQTVSK